MVEYIRVDYEQEVNLTHTATLPTMKIHIIYVQELMPDINWNALTIQYCTITTTFRISKWNNFWLQTYNWTVSHWWILYSSITYIFMMLAVFEMPSSWRFWHHFWMFRYRFLMIVVFWRPTKIRRDLLNYILVALYNFRTKHSIHTKREIPKCHKTIFTPCGAIPVIAFHKV